MGLFDDLQGTKKESVSGGSAALSAALSAPAGDTSIYKEKTVKKGGKKGGKKSAGSKSGGVSSRKGGAAVIPFSDRGAASPGIVTGGGLSADLLPVSVDDVSRLLPLWVAAWCDNNDVQDVRKVSPLIFRSLCAYIGLHIKQSHILRDYTIRTAAGVGRSACNSYNPEKVAALFACFTSFCDSCDKVPFASSFAAFSGVSLSYVREYGDRLTSVGLDIRKKTHEAEMDSIRQKTSADPVGRLAILNNEYYSGGMSGGSGSDHVAVSLPASGVFGLISSDKID